MYFVNDPSALSYYLGEKEPTPGFAKKLLFETSHPLVAVDVETISLKERIAIGIGIAISPTEAFYFRTFPEESQAIPWHLLKSTGITKIYHNSLFDLSALREFEVDNTNILDTNVMSRLLGYKFNSLVDLGMVHQLPITEAKEMMPSKGTMLNVDPDEVARKCMYDCLATYRLYQDFWARVDQQYVATEMQVIPICIEMSNRGLKIDQEMRSEVEGQLQEQADYYYSLCDNEGFNPGSPQQVAYMLAKRGAYSVFHRLPFTRNYRKRSLSTAVEILEKMDDPLASIVLAYRGYSKLLSTYIRPWAKEDRATTRFHLDAITGRPSSTDRNMQNIPGKKLQAERGYPNCRNILLPDSGTWTDVDWSQLELRILAYLSQDREMLHIYEVGGDIHQTTADFLDIPRATAKNVNFALVYGATDQTLMETAHIRSIERARQLRENIFRLFTGVGDWIETLNHGIPSFATTVFGRTIRLPDPEEESIDGIYRKNINYRIQGTAAEILKRGLIILKDLPLALQVHDEVLCDGYFSESTFEPLEHIAPFRTPVEVKYLARWE